jgi:hypothetical protein
MQKIGSALSSTELSEEKALRRKHDAEWTAINKAIGPAPKAVDPVMFYMRHEWSSRLGALYQQEHGQRAPNVSARTEYVRNYWSTRESPAVKDEYAQLCADYNRKALDDHKQLVTLTTSGAAGRDLSPAERER